MYKIFTSHGHSFDSHAKSSLNIYYAWDACDLAARCGQSRKAVWVVVQQVASSLPHFHCNTPTQHGCQKSDTCGKLPEIFKAK